MLSFTLLLQAGSIALGAALPTTSPPKSCDVPQTVNFGDLTGITSGAPGELNPPVKNPCEFLLAVLNGS